jgi:DNA-binding NarL/FixJ family response regulator
MHARNRFILQIARRQPREAVRKATELSSPERQILQLVAACKSTADIAHTLFLSSKTVDTYRSRLMQNSI